METLNEIEAIRLEARRWKKAAHNDSQSSDLGSLTFVMLTNIAERLLGNRQVSVDSGTCPHDRETSVRGELLCIVSYS